MPRLPKMRRLATISLERPSLHGEPVQQQRKQRYHDETRGGGERMVERAVSGLLGDDDGLGGRVVEGPAGVLGAFDDAARRGEDGVQPGLVRLELPRQREALVGDTGECLIERGLYLA